MFAAIKVIKIKKKTIDNFEDITKACKNRKRLSQSFACV